MKRAIISVSNKTGIVEFASGLQELGFEIISTGGTAKVLQESGIEIIKISEVTNFPEMMDGRVKTLHPNVHGGILARRVIAADMQELSELGIKPIDLVVVNLYPFKETIAQAGVELDEALENIDIGGPTMLRSAAKNFKDVAVVVDNNDYAAILSEIKESDGKLSFKTKMRLAQKAFNHTANYDQMIDQYFIEQLKTHNDSSNDDHFNDKLPEQIQFHLEKVADLRYGENPHQNAAFYREIGTPLFNSVSTAKQLHGKALSFNNLNDANGALELVREFNEPAAVIIKHTNPCGAAVAESLVDAFERAYLGDPRSAYGSIVAVNRTLDLATAKSMISGQRFIEIILAPTYEAQALEILKQRWKNVRILEVGEIKPYSEFTEKYPLYDIKYIQGGFLIQELDKELLNQDNMSIPTHIQPLPEQFEDLKFAWTIVKHVKSNAIVLVKDRALIGVGAGQLSRVDAMSVAIMKAEERANGSVAASDAFIPFGDSIDQAALAGVTAIIQPGGSIRDEEVIKACNEQKIPMILTAIRHFKH